MTRTFSVVSGNWSAGANWSPSGVPQTVDTIIIPAGTQCFFDAAASSGPYTYLTVDGSLRLDSTNPIVFNSGVQNGTGTIDLFTNGILEVSGFADFAFPTTGTLNVSFGTVRLSFSGGIIEYPAGFTFYNLDVTSTITPSVAMKISHTLSVSGSFHPFATVEMLSGSTFGGGGTIQFENLVIPPGTVTVSGTATVKALTVAAGASFESTGTIIANGTMTVDPSSNLAFHNLTSNNAGIDGNIFISGNLSLNHIRSLSNGIVVMTGNGSITGSSGPCNLGESIGNLQIAPGKTVTTDATFSISGNLLVSSGASLTASAGQIGVCGGGPSSIDNNGTLMFNDLKFEDFGNYASGSSFQIAGSLTGGTNHGARFLSVAPGLITMTGTSKTLNAPFPSVFTVDNLKITGSYSGSAGAEALGGGLQIMNSLVVDPGASLNFTSGTLAARGTITNNGGTDALTLTALLVTQTLTSNGTGRIRINGKLNTGALGSSTVTFNNALLLADGASITGVGTARIAASATVPAGATVTLTHVFVSPDYLGGTLAIQAGGTFTVDGTFTPDVEPQISGAGTLNGSGTVQVTRNVDDAFNAQYAIATKILASLTVDYTFGTIAPNSAISNVTYGNLKISGLIQVADATATITGALIVTGYLDTYSGTLTLAGPASSIVNTGVLRSEFLITGACTTSTGFNVRLAAKFTVNPGATFTATAGTVAFEGAGYIRNNGSATFANVYIGNQLASTVADQGSGFNVNGTMTVAGWFEPNPSIVVGGTGGLNGNGGSVYVTRQTGTSDFRGQYAMSGTLALDNLNINFNGSSPQGLGNSINYGTLNIMNPTIVSVGSNVTTRSLVLLSGDVDATSFPLTVSQNTTDAVYLLSGKVRGELRRAVNEFGGAYLFPIGQGGVYAPVTVYSPGGAATQIAARTTNGDHPSPSGSGFDPARSVNRYWTLSSSVPLSANVIFSWPDSDRDATATCSSFIVRRFNGTWANTNSDAAVCGNPASIGITGFDLGPVTDFYIADQTIDHYNVSVPNVHYLGQTFTTTVMAIDVLNALVYDSTTVVTMSATGSAQFDGNGNATFGEPGDNVRTLNTGTFGIATRDQTIETITITATDANGKTGSTGSISIQKTPTATFVSDTPPTVFGQNMTYHATVIPVGGGSGIPPGTVEFRSDGTAIDGCTAAAVGALGPYGHATCDTAALTVGTHAITAFYSGSPLYEASDTSSSPVGHTVNKAGSTTSLQSSMNPSKPGDNVTFTATITITPPGDATIGGTVTFNDGAAVLCSSIAITGTTAVCSSATLTSGQHVMTAVYSGTSELESSSGTVTQVVSASGAAPYLVKNINAGSASSSPSFIAAMHDGRAIFAATDANGIEPWVSDGTTAGTVMLHDIESGPGSSSPHDFVVFSGATFFSATTTANGTEMWKTSGTDSGTMMLKDINPGAASSNPSRAAVSNGMLFFGAGDGSSGAELWKSSGSEAGTTRVSDIVPGAASSTPDLLTNVATTLYFVADHPGVGRDLARSDGTAAGTSYILSDSASNPPNPRELLAKNNLLFFVEDGMQPGELWATSTGFNYANREANVNFAGDDGVTGLRSVGTLILFTADDGLHGREIWRFDSVGDFDLVKDINLSGDGLTGLSSAAVANGLVYFAANNGVDGVELWKSDGTEAGTTMVLDLCSGACSSNPQNFVASGNRVYFQATTPESGAELWVTDGTPGGTTLVADGEPGVNGSSPQNLTAVGNLIYYTATSPATGVELYAACTTTTSKLGATAPASVGQNVASSLEIRALDSLNALVPCYTGTVALTSSDPSATLPGNHTFTEGEGRSSFPFTLHTLGTQTITATDTVDPTITVTVTVMVKTPTTTALSSSLNPSANGQSVTFTATVTPSVPGAVTGSVAFFDGATQIGNPSIGGSNQASFSTSSLTPGVHSITAVYAGDATYATSTSTAVSQQVVPAAPVLLSAIAASTTLVNVTWQAVAGASSYQIYRTTDIQVSPSLAGTAASTDLSFPDSGVSGNTTYVYTVKAAGTAGESAASNTDAATTIVFTDADLTNKPVSGTHMLEIRKAVNALLVAAHQSATFSTTNPSQQSITAQNIIDLRNAIDLARGLLFLPAFAWTNPAPTQGTTHIRASDFYDLRNGPK